MDEIIIGRHNELVRPYDTVVHAGDLCFSKSYQEVHIKYISRLMGHHIFLTGNHDYWMSKQQFIWEKKIDDQLVVVCHYAMRVWNCSHFNSWQLYGHNHGKLDPIGKQWDIGVDNNHFYPVSFDEVKKIMKTRPDNSGLIKR